MLSQFRYDEHVWQRVFSTSSLLHKVNRWMMDVLLSDVFPAALARFDSETKACISNYKTQCLNAELNLNSEMRKWVSAHFYRAASRYVSLVNGSIGEASSFLGVTAATEGSMSKGSCDEFCAPFFLFFYYYVFRRSSLDGS